MARAPLAASSLPLPPPPPPHPPANPRPCGLVRWVVAYGAEGGGAGGALPLLYALHESYGGGE